VLSEPATHISPTSTARGGPPGRGLAIAVAALTLVRLASVGAGFLASVLGARLIGADGLGIIGAALTIATLCALTANGGLNIATIYLLGRRPHERREIVGQVAVMATAAAILAAAAVFLAGFLLRTTVLGGASASLLLAAAATGAGILLFELGGGVLLGLHRRSQYIGIQAVEALSSLALTALILVAISRSATGFLAAAANGYWAGALAAAFLARRQLGPLPLGVRRSFAGEALGIGLRGQVGNILQYLNLRLDLLLVPALLNLASAGVYLVAVRISEVLTQVSSSSAAFLFPHVAAQAERDATATTERATRMTLVVVVLGGLPLLLLAEPILSLAFGDEFVGGAGALRIMLVAMLPLSLVRIMAGDLKGRGRPGTVSLAALTALVATVVLDLLLIPLLGIEGAALASLLTYSTSAAMLLVIYRRLTGGSLRALVPATSDLRSLLAMGRRAATRRRATPGTKA
jgi:O-antigen/teichoic acid export membrane protein